MQLEHHISRAKTLALLTTYSPFLFMLGLVLGLIIHAFKPIVLLPIYLLMYGQIIGFVSLALATALFIWVHQARKIFFTELRNENICVEVCRGPYKIGRHPGALSLVLLLFAVSFVTNSLALFLLTFVLVAIFTWIIHPFQEMLLLDKCGDVYRDYKKNVRMWF